MEWLLDAYKHDVLRVSICTLLYMSFSLNTGVTCASPHLICQNIFFFSPMMFCVQNAACPLSHQGNQREGIT